MRVIVLILGMIITMTITTQAQEIQWISWEEATRKMESEPRKIYVDVYTQVCGWCKKMDKTTYSNPKIISYINTNYYPIKFDAQMREDIELNGKKFQYTKMGRSGYHELAHTILSGKLSFPSIVVMDTDLRVIQAIPGYRDVKTLDMILNFYADDYHKSMPWKSFVSMYSKKKEAPTRKAIQVQNVGNQHD